MFFHTILHQHPIRRWNTAVHLTTAACLPQIAAVGLMPQVGERSESVGDIAEYVWFMPSLYMVPPWKHALYKNSEWQDIAVLRLKPNKQTKLYEVCNTERSLVQYVSTSPIPPQRLHVLNSIVDKNTRTKISLHEFHLRVKKQFSKTTTQDQQDIFLKAYKFSFLPLLKYTRLLKKG